MSAWRAKALELFPELRESVLHAKDYGAVWRLVHREFRASLAAGRGMIATPFFKYAAWTLGPSPQAKAMPEVSQAAAEIFFEFADSLHQWVDRHDFMHAQKGLRFHLGESRYAEFEHRFLELMDGYIKKRDKRNSEPVRAIDDQRSTTPARLRPTPRSSRRDQ